MIKVVNESSLVNRLRTKAIIDKGWEVTGQIGGNYATVYHPDIDKTFFVCHTGKNQYSINGKSIGTLPEVNKEIKRLVSELT